MTDPVSRFRYERIVAKDRTYDGQFLTGVHTTGIYCLPSCPARKPKLDNVSFFDSETDAIAAGLRPCKRCCPDVFYRGTDWDAELYQDLLARIRTDTTKAVPVGAMAELCGVSVSKLNDLTRNHAHLTPAALLRRERMRSAKGLLLRSKEPIIDVGFASGFDSAATFHRQFLLSTGMTPGAYRALRESESFLIRLPNAYLATEVFAYFSRDAEQTVERVAGRTISKAFMAESGPVILSIEFRPDDRHVWCALHTDLPLSPADRAHGHEIAVKMLGLENDAQAFEARAARDPLVARLVAGRTGLRPPMTANAFEALVWAVVGQQVNLSFATNLRRSVIGMAGQRIRGSELMLHPSASEIANLDIGDLVKVKFSRSKADYLIGAAQAMVKGDIDLEQLKDASAVLAERSLKAVRGLGPWSAAYIMMRGLGFSDCILIGDSGLNEGLKRFFNLEHRPDISNTQALMENFAPHKSLATCHLWASLKERV